MKKVKNVVALGLAVLTAFAFAACNESDKKDKKRDKDDKKDSNPVQEISEDYAGYLQEKFDISEDDIRELDPSELPNNHAFEGEYYICIDGDMPDMECNIYDDADEAREYFVTRYDIFNERFDEEHFEGDYQIDLEDDSGYIVINGTNSGVGIFGDWYAYGDNMLYAGMYYDGNTVLVIRPRNEVTVDRVEEIISTMGLPMANGENT